MGKLILIAVGYALYRVGALGLIGLCPSGYHVGGDMIKGCVKDCGPGGVTMEIEHSTGEMVCAPARPNQPCGSAAEPGKMYMLWNGHWECMDQSEFWQRNQSTAKGLSGWFA